MASSWILHTFLLSFVMIHASFNKKRIEVDIYFETQCPDSIRFIKKQLYPVFKELKNKNMVNFNLYPYGNVKVKKCGDFFNFKCQHGKTECYLNMIENCLKFIYRKTPNKVIPYVHCLAKKPVNSSAERCAKEQHLDWPRIKECGDGGFGKALFHEAGQKTEKSEKKFVPFIVIDNDASRNKAAVKSLKKEICKKIKGPKPEVCKH